MLNKGKIRVLLVDDHAGMREGISAVVNAQPDMMVVGEAADGHEAIQRFRELQPDVSVVDWNLPMVRGEEVLVTLNKEFPNARFVVITALNGDDSIRQALSLGAQCTFTRICCGANCFRPYGQFTTVSATSRKR